MSVVAASVWFREKNVTRVSFSDELGGKLWSDLKVFIMSHSPPADSEV